MHATPAHGEAKHSPPPPLALLAPFGDPARLLRNDSAGRERGGGKGIPDRAPAGLSTRLQAGSRAGGCPARQCCPPWAACGYCGLLLGVAEGAGKGRPPRPAFRFGSLRRKRWASRAEKGGGHTGGSRGRRILGAQGGEEASLGPSELAGFRADLFVGSILASADEATQLGS